MPRVQLRYIDHDSKATQVSWKNGNVVSDENYEDEEALASTMQTTLTALLRGALDNYAYWAVDSDQNPTAPATIEAQKSIRWRIIGRDTITGLLYTESVGTAYLSLATVTDTDGNNHVPLGSGAGLAFKNAYDAFAPLSPEDNPMTLQDVVYTK